jgi:hypothetical protein
MGICNFLIGQFGNLKTHAVDWRALRWDSENRQPQQAFVLNHPDCATELPAYKLQISGMLAPPDWTRLSPSR